VRNNPLFGLIRVMAAITDYLNRIDMFSAGKKIIQSLYDGIMSVLNLPIMAMQYLAQKIRDLLPFSPAKTGPLSTLDKVDFITPIIKGFNKFPILNSMQNLAENIWQGAGRQNDIGGISLVVNVNTSSNASPSQIGQGVADAVISALRRAYRS